MANSNASTKQWSQGCCHSTRRCSDASRLAKAARESVLVGMAGLRRLQQLPFEQVLPSQVDAFSKAIRAKLRDRASPFAKDYLRAAVDLVVVVNGDTATISGSHARLMRTIVGKKMGTDQVPTFIPHWRARRDSNSRPLRSKRSTLSN